MMNGGLLLAPRLLLAASSWAFVITCGRSYLALVMPWEYYLLIEMVVKPSHQLDICWLAINSYNNAEKIIFLLYISICR